VSRGGAAYLRASDEFVILEVEFDALPTTSLLP